MNSEPKTERSYRATCTDRRLDNGLRVIVHEDHSTPIVTVNILYHVGSKNERPGQRGFAHLFEHLMFDGSKNIKRGGYDYYCTMAGGDNNAFTTPDLTDYHISLPGDHLELGLWLESDRMAEFAVGEDSLETQKSVVLEEKRQTIDNTPYGNLGVTMRELAYAPDHPYNWEPIGNMEELGTATLEDVRSFYRAFYLPTNAVLVIAGDIDTDDALYQAGRYFGSISGGTPPRTPTPSTALLHHGRSRRLSDHIIPFNAAFLAWHAPSCRDNDILALELLTGILAEGESSRFYKSLEYSRQIASETEAFIEDGEVGSLFYVYAIAQNNRITPDVLREALLAELHCIGEEGIEEKELQKVRNRKATRIARDLQSVSSRAERLAYFATLFDTPELAFREMELYDAITVTDIQRAARLWLTGTEPCVVEYIAVGNKNTHGE